MDLTRRPVDPSKIRGHYSGADLRENLSLFRVGRAVSNGGASHPCTKLEQIGPNERRLAEGGEGGGQENQWSREHHETRVAEVDQGSVLSGSLLSATTT